MEHIALMKEKNTISQLDTRLILVTDSIEEAIVFIKDKSIARYGLIAERKKSPARWLFEHTWSIIEMKLTKTQLIIIIILFIVFISLAIKVWGIF